MTMTVENLRDILSGLVQADMGDLEFRMYLSNHNYDPSVIESVSITRNIEGALVPAFSGKLDNA